MKGGADVPENIEDTDMNDEQTEEIYRQEGKKYKFSDIIFVQIVMCMIAVILFIGVNICNTELAADIYGVYTEKSADADGITGAFEVIIDFLRSTPRDNA